MNNYYTFENGRLVPVPEDLASAEPSLALPSQPAPARVQEMAAEIERLRAELAASKAPPLPPPDPIHYAIRCSGAPRSMIQYGRPGVLLIR